MIGEVFKRLVAGVGLEITCAQIVSPMRVLGVSFDRVTLVREAVAASHIQ